MESNENLISDEAIRKNDSEKKYTLMGGAAVLGISGLSALIAGLVTSHISKKKNKEFLKEVGKELPPQVLVESPFSLALRALAWGTVWAVGGFSLIMYGVWKWYGFKDMNDLQTRLRSNIKKSAASDQRTEFENVKDFLNYLNETSKNEKKTKNT